METAQMNAHKADDAQIDALLAKIAFLEARLAAGEAAMLAVLDLHKSSFLEARRLRREVVQLRRRSTG